jgi:endonuclease I
MAIPLRVIQEFYREEDGTRTYTKYRMEMKIYGNWKEVPVIEREVERPREIAIYKGPREEYILKC